MILIETTKKNKTRRKQTPKKINQKTSRKQLEKQKDDFKVLESFCEIKTCWSAGVNHPSYNVADQSPDFSLYISVVPSVM